MKAEKECIGTTLFPTDFSVCPGRQQEVCLGSSVCRGQTHCNIACTVECLTNYNHSSQGGPTISLFLPFLVFFPHSNHHYFDKLLTLPEKLNYINNSTMKILSPSEKCTAANKNLPDFHQATWAWTIVTYDCVVLPEILSSVHSLLYMCICMCSTYSFLSAVSFSKLL